jgi:dihydropteroate synthase
MEELARVVARGEAAVMGVCNVTPDSFSDGGVSFDAEASVARVDALFAEGAFVVDVGGESTRPGAPRVSPDEQIRRVSAAVQHASTRGFVSIDTTSAKVAARALELGAHVVNDVSSLSEPELAEVVASYGAVLVLSHARGPQEHMAGFGAWPEDAYGDVVDDVLRDLDVARTEAEKRGVRAFVVDPGLGFSKSSSHSLELLRRTSELVARAGHPVLVGASRKSFLTLAVGQAPPLARLGASIAAAVAAQAGGAAIVRVHDVEETRQALSLSAALGPRFGRAAGMEVAPC